MDVSDVWRKVYTQALGGGMTDPAAVSVANDAVTAFRSFYPPGSESDEGAALWADVYAEKIGGGSTAVQATDAANTGVASFMMAMATIYDRRA